MMDSSMDSYTALLPARQQSITEARSHVKEGLQAKQDPEPISFDLRVRPSQSGWRVLTTPCCGHFCRDPEILLESGRG